MDYYDRHALHKGTWSTSEFPGADFVESTALTKRQVEVLNIYADRHEKNAHKMEMPPACEIPENFRG